MEKIKVLIADDIDVLAQITSKIILKKDYVEVIGIVENGEEEYSKILELQPDIVITDNKMPKMNGIEVIRKILKSDLEKKPFFILATADFDVDLFNECAKNDVYFLNKPIIEDCLLNILSTIEAKINHEKRYKKWLDQYMNKEIREIKSLFSANNLEKLIKLGIEIKDSKYTENELDLIEMDLYAYYKDCKEMTKEELEETKELKDTGVSRLEYNKILKKFDKIANKFRVEMVN